MKLEIGHNLAIVLEFVVISLGVCVLLVGGCAVEGYYKTKAIELMPQGHTIKSTGFPGDWNIERKRD